MLAQSAYRCKQHLSSIHDFFISYRVASEAQIAEDLFGELTALKKHNGESIKVFWDQRCLNDAANWQEGFLNGLKGSRIIVLLISVASLSRMASSTGSQDNLLFEYEEALELTKTGTVSIFPVFIGTTKEISAEFSHVDGASNTEQQMAYFPFSFSHANLAKFPSVAHSTSGKSVRETISQIFGLQGANYTPKGINHLAKQLRELLYNLEEQNANRLRAQVLRFEKINLPGIYLSRLSLGRLNLVGANFSRALLPFADFKDCVCIDVNFTRAFLQGATFDGSDLRDAVFDEADCSGCWEDNKFKHSVFSNPVALPTRFASTNFSFAVLQNFNALSTNFEACLFTGTTFTGKFLNVKLSQCAITHATFADVEFSGDWRSDCSDTVFKGCRFSPPSNLMNAGRFNSCSFFDTTMHAFPGLDFVNCRFEKCSFGARGINAVVDKFSGCKFVECKFLNIKSGCHIFKSKLVDCEFTECDFASFKDCEIQVFKWKANSLEVALVENVVIGIPPVRYVGTDDAPLAKQPTSVSFQYFTVNFKKVQGLRSSGVVWRDTFPGSAVMKDAKFKFNTVQQAKEFAARLEKTGAKVESSFGDDGVIKDNKWEGHKTSLVCVNCENSDDDNTFLK